jgi:hypothetical protein
MAPRGESTSELGGSICLSGLFGLSVWFIRLVWFNHTHETDQIDLTDEIDQFPSLLSLLGRTAVV